MKVPSYAHSLLLFTVVVTLVGFTLSQTYCPNAPDIQEDRRTNKNRLVISTFNTEWLFTGNRSGLSTCPGTGCTWKDPEQARYHLSNIADIIKKVNADIMVVEEVENCVVLRQLLALPQLVNEGYKPYMVQGTDTATGQNVGLITRVDPTTNLKRTAERASWPVLGNTCNYNKVTDGKTSAVSKHLYTTFQINGLPKPLLLIGVHLLAFPVDAARCVEREAQATVIRGLIDQHPNHEVVVLGDFNDYDADLVDESKVSIPTSRVISMIKGNSLINSATTLPASKTGVGIFSSWWDKNNNCKDDAGLEHTVIDHILVSKTLPLKSFAFLNTLFTASCAANISDHWPLVAELDLTKVSKTQTVPETVEETAGETQGVATTQTIGGGVTGTVPEVREGEYSTVSVGLLVVLGVAVVMSIGGLIVFLVLKKKGVVAEETVLNSKV